MRRLSSGLFVLDYRHPASRGWRLAIPNGVTYEGVDYLLDAAFRGATQYGTWYGGLVDDAGFSTLAPGDTHAAHAGWTESLVYGSTRPAWAVGPAAAGVLVSSAPCVFSIAADGTVRGAFLASRSATGTGAGAVIWATAAASSGRAVSAGGTLSLTYTTRLSPR